MVQGVVKQPAQHVLLSAKSHALALEAVQPSPNFVHEPRAPDPDLMNNVNSFPDPKGIKGW